MTREWKYRDGSVRIYHGDCLDVIDELVDEGLTISAVIMDPPYASGTRKEMGKASSGAMLRGERFASRPIENDQMTTQGFVWLMRAVAQRVRPILPDGGHLLSFIDWRQWPNLVGAFETCNYRVQSMIVWDKRVDRHGEWIPTPTRADLPRVKRGPDCPRPRSPRCHHLPPGRTDRPPVTEADSADAAAIGSGDRARGSHP